MASANVKETRQGLQPSARQQATAGTQPHTGAGGWPAFRGASTVSAGPLGTWNSACVHPEGNSALFVAALPVTRPGRNTTRHSGNVCRAWPLLCSVGLPPLYAFLPGDAIPGGERSGAWSHEEPLRAVGPFGLTGASLCFLLLKTAQPPRRPQTLLEGKGPALPTR